MLKSFFLQVQICQHGAGLEDLRGIISNSFVNIFQLQVDFIEPSLSLFMVLLELCLPDPQRGEVLVVGCQLHLDGENLLVFLVSLFFNLFERLPN